MGHPPNRDTTARKDVGLVSGLNNPAASSQLLVDVLACLGFGRAGC